MKYDKTLSMKALLYFITVFCLTCEPIFQCLHFEEKIWNNRGATKTNDQ